MLFLCYEYRTNIDYLFHWKFHWSKVTTKLSIELSLVGYPCFMKLTMTSFFTTVWGLFSEDKTIAFNSLQFGFLVAAKTVRVVNYEKFAGHSSLSWQPLFILARNERLGWISLGWLHQHSRSRKLTSCHWILQEISLTSNVHVRSLKTPSHKMIFWFWTCRMTSRTIRQPFSVLVASWYWGNSCFWSSRNHW